MVSSNFIYYVPNTCLKKMDVAHEATTVLTLHANVSKLCCCPIDFFEDNISHKNF